MRVPAGVAAGEEGDILHEEVRRAGRDEVRAPLILVRFPVPCPLTGGIGQRDVYMPIHFRFDRASSQPIGEIESRPGSRKHNACNAAGDRNRTD